MIGFYDAIGTVKTKRDYKTVFSLMKTVEECADYPNPYKAEFVIACKRRMREYTHFDRNKFVYNGKYEVTRHFVKDYGIDGCVELLYLPKECEDYEDAKWFFEEFLYMERPHSMYDCTGESFTSWYHIFNRKGRYCAYHAISVDI